MERLFQTPLDLFGAAEVQALEARVQWRDVRGKSTPHVRCIVRDKDIQLKPEEVVRQLFAAQLLEKYGYPKARIAFEHPIAFGREKKSADIVIFDKDRPDTAYIIVETKKPKLKDGKDQLKSYCHATGAPIAVWTNGGQISFYHRKDPNYFEDIPAIPAAHEKLSDILTERWTMDDLRRKDKLVTERKSLKSLVLEMEDEVLANAGVDVFEELFKLIFTKLYDEMKSGRDAARHLQFRNYGDTESELKEKIHTLFTDAKKTWEGVFAADSKIELTAAHLSICVASLQDVKLFNSNLEVVDEAFEYLISKSSKGEKGQYFTPRYVIDMCVKMLNPQAHETLIDTAAGSCGFPVHGIFHVWEHILKAKGLSKSHLFSAEHKPVACTDYVNEKIFAIDFDEKAVRVARTLNLIAGDGQTNVLHLNTLDWQNWDQTVKEDAWVDTYHSGWKKLRRLQRGQDYRYFEFDILMAKPPFAGDIKQSALLSQYELARDAKGKLKSKVGRDILFIERNLNFLKPGGRMAIVLPQGRFNNASDAHIRHWLAQHGRILAVVGLHGNVFKPHTGTKTSVLFFQKWHETLCPRVDDYPIFFATMQKPSKDNSGEKIYLKNPDGSKRLDSHGHLVVDHDLFNHEGMTADGIAEAFIEFAKKEKLAFFLSSESGFDAEKYAALLENIELSEVRFSDAFSAERLDAEYFKKKYLNTNAGNKNFVSFDKVASFLIGPFGSSFAVENYADNSGYRYIRGKDVKAMRLEDSDNVYVPEADFKRLKKYALKDNDILISVVGTIGNAALVKQENLPAIFSCKSTAVRTTINPNYLLAFLNCCFAQQQMQRKERGIIQKALNLPDLKSLEIFIPSDLFQKKISVCLENSNILLKKSNGFYESAQKLLLDELGLSNWQPSTKNTAICNFKDSFGKTGRLDAECYQPRYAEMVNAIQRYPGGFDLLVKGVTLHTQTVTPEEDAEYQYIELSNIGSHGEITGCTLDAGRNLPTRARYQVSTGQVLLSSIEGSLSSIVVVPQAYDGAFCSTGFYPLSSERFNSETLLLFFKSPAGQMQLQRGCSGTILTAINNQELSNILMPKIAPPVQQQIQQQVQQSFALRQQSRTLLEHAKHAVELAIEHDENRALAFLSHSA